ncbi:MAG: hypothetical protein AAGE96_14710 [Cyanobacteria bacterium P01_G01_bin.19]
MSISPNERKDHIVYFLLNKIKENGESMEEVSYTKEDFDNREVTQEEVKQHLQFALDSKYLEGEMAEGDGSVWATCKNAVLTTEGRNVLRKDFFKV